MYLGVDCLFWLLSEFVVLGQSEVVFSCFSSYLVNGQISCGSRDLKLEGLGLTWECFCWSEEIYYNIDDLKEAKLFANIIDILEQEEI